MNDQWVASAGGHFESFELNDPRACVLRELREELGLTEKDLIDLNLRYIGLRNVNGEIRQNYYFFADLQPERFESFESNEGKCRWVDLKDVLDYDMPLTAKFVMAHYVNTGRLTECLYAAVSNGEGFDFIELRES